MRTATSTKGKPAVFHISGPGNVFGVESEHDTFKYWRVSLDTLGNATCLGADNGDRCWPFHLHATCKHCDAVLALGAEEAPVRRPRSKMRLEDLFPE